MGVFVRAIIANILGEILLSGCLSHSLDCGFVQCIACCLQPASSWRMAIYFEPFMCTMVKQQSLEDSSITTAD